MADVARRSGFTPATLRYYYEIGLLPAPDDALPVLHALFGLAA